MNNETSLYYSVGVVDANECAYCVTFIFKMTEQEEERICIKFCSRLEHSSAETTQMTQKAFRDDAMSAVKIKLWHERFKDGGESIESHPHSGRSATRGTPENVECIQAAINKDRRTV